MKGYRTGGDWSDITSYRRNDIVFEGRNKAYGAYNIRRRYGNHLLMALFCSVTFALLCATMPYILQKILHHEPPLLDASTSVVIPQILPPVTANQSKATQAVKQRKTSKALNNAPPVIDTKTVDSVQKNDKPVLTASLTTTGTGTISAPPNEPAGNGAGNETPGGGSSSLPMDNSIHTFVSQMPEFPDGSLSAYILNNIEYPDEEQEYKVQGTVYVYFIIEADGSVSNVRIEKGIEGGAGLEREAKKVVSGMPKWIPGKQDGHPARVQFIIPIQFRLK